MKRGAGTWWTVLAIGLVAGSGLERWAQSAGPVARAASPPPEQAGELLPLLTDTNDGKLLFLIDGKQKIVSVYEYTQRKSKFKLVAVRQVADVLDIVGDGATRLVQTDHDALRT